MKFSLEDTIAAISTPIGESGIGIVRLSGMTAINIADKLFAPSSGKNLQGLATHTLNHGWVKDGEKPVDEAMLSVMKGPNSYTGEDTVEISAHGGPVILARILSLCLENGARLAEKGEFTFRAYINGKMDLARAEAVTELIHSKTGLAAEASVNQLRGGLSNEIENWRKSLVGLLSKIEAALDHAEEDIIFVTRKELALELETLSNEIEGLLKTADKGRLLRDGLKISIIGKPNCGKSSLLNAMLERDRAIVTDIPGTTRDLLEEYLELEGVPIVVVDTAGIRAHSQDLVEKIGQQKTKESALGSDLLLWILDSSVPLSDEDRQISGMIKDHSLSEKTLIVLNKSDLPSKICEKDVSDIFQPVFPSVKVSAFKKTNLGSLEKAILGFSKTAGSSKDSVLLICTRHAEILRKVHAFLADAKASVEKEESEEFIAFHLKAALDKLGEITGETATEEILDNIFSRFCVGK